MKHIAIIGAGIAGIEAASRLSKFGHKIYLIEKNAEIG
jgi:heterodisulfide reductase subunit A-like polyferredoxin